MNYFLIFIISLILSVVLTGFVRRFALGRGLVIKPRERDIHTKPLPRIGGIAIALAFIVVSLIYFLIVKPDSHITTGHWLGYDKKIVSIWISGVIIALGMLYDDICGLKAYSKFAIQILVVVIIAASGIGLDSLPNPFGQAINLNSVYLPINLFGTIYHFSFWSDLLTLFWLVGMMNVINFIDGIDGLAAGVSAIAFFILYLLSLAVYQGPVAAISIILCGSAVGFLYWNFYPAKIFMGDSGSMFLGLLLGVLPLISGGKLATSFLVLGFAIVDGLIVAGARIIRGKNPFTTPDKTHLHHRFLAAGFSVPATVLSLYAIAALFGWVALRSTTMNKIIASTVLIVVIGVLILILNQIKKIKRK
ncbi:MAG: MraY family glycosyltransferase [Candidatus Berkelbacteria bacterium]|nr:MraY family glycosyltransferase [Candidatus Berkelbacteria bacterium]